MPKDEDLVNVVPGLNKSIDSATKKLAKNREEQKKREADDKVAKEEAAYNFKPKEAFDWDAVSPSDII